VIKGEIELNRDRLMEGTEGRFGSQLKMLEDGKMSADLRNLKRVY
jgi:hypothetical protein